MTSPILLGRGKLGNGPPIFNFKPNQCEITLKFDKEEKLDDYSYSGC